MASGVVAWLVCPRFCSDYKRCALNCNPCLAGPTPVFFPEIDAQGVVAPRCSSSPLPITMWRFFPPTWHWPPQAPGWFKSLFSYSDCSSCHTVPCFYPAALWPSGSNWAAGALLPPGGAHPTVMFTSSLRLVQK